MEKREKIPLIEVTSFADAAEAEVEYYANSDWQESVRIVEEMRRMIWSKEYLLGRDKSISIASINDDRDE